jgi:hypothetical protein
MTCYPHRARDYALALFATALAVGMLSCAEITYAFPTNAIQMPVREQYEMWWNVTQACSKVPGRFSDVTWYVVPGPSTFLSNGVASYGAYYPDSHSIFIAETALDDGWLVRHEMLHALLRAGGHPSDYFQARCGGIVICDPSECAPLAPSPVDTATLPVAKLGVSLNVTPEILSDGSTGGWFTIVVSATNPSANAVWIKLDQRPDSLVFGWGYTMLGGYVRDLLDNQRVGFAGGETKRHTFDLQLVPGQQGVHTAPGTYRFDGRYNSVTAQPVVIVVAPR